MYCYRIVCDVDQAAFSLAIPNAVRNPHIEKKGRKKERKKETDKKQLTQRYPHHPHPQGPALAELIAIC
jgi:hypothetical protein